MPEAAHHGGRGAAGLHARRGVRVVQRKLETGTLERGKLADFAIIDRTTFTQVAPAELNAARVMMTAAGSRVVHSDAAL